MFPREGVDVESRQKGSCKVIIKSGKAVQPWARFGVGCMASGLGLLGFGKVFASYQEKCPLQHPSALQVSQNFYLWVMTNFYISGVPSSPRALSVCPVRPERCWSLTPGRKFLSTLISLGSFHLIRSSLQCLCPDSTLAPCSSDASPDSQAF